MNKIKNFSYLVFLCLNSIYAWSQGTGIGTTSPDPSAALEIKDPAHGLLIPSVALQTRSDKTTIPSPANGLLLYNKTLGLYAGEGFYFNSGTPVSPSWRSISELQLPYIRAGAEDEMVSLNNSKGSEAITLHTSNVQGYALGTLGKIRFAGNNQSTALGKELTSDALGNATWAGAVAFRSTGVVGGGSEQISGGLAYEKRIPFAFEEYDLSGNYNDAAETPNSAFVAPVKGIYNFNVGVSWIVQNPASAPLVALYIRRLRGGSEEILNNMFRNGTDGAMTFSSDVMLEPNDLVYVTIRHTTALEFITLKNPTFFTGKLMIRQ